MDWPYVLAGLLLGCVITVSLCRPEVGRMFARSFAVITLGIGVALLVWAVVALVRREPIRPIYFGFDSAGIVTVSEAFAWSGGFLAGGTTALVLSFWRSGPKPGPSKG
jgi:hypothetical protein